MLLFSYMVGFACWEVLALGHGARGSEEQVQMVSTKQWSAIDYNRHGGWMEVSSLIERKSEIGLHVDVKETAHVAWTDVGMSRT